MSQYIIEYAAQKNFAIGVTDKMAGKSVVLLDLRKNPDPSKYIWEVQDDFTIALHSSSDNLIIDAANLTDQSPLILSTYDPDNVTKTQKWRYKDSFFKNDTNTKYCIDLDNRKVSDGSTIWVYTSNGSPAQQWILSPYSSQFVEQLTNLK
ncbi:hypothetical protein WS62_31300 [Burkholderia sp. ABCPW 14]|uniref:RICIN domain-containing protein n=1 Tax=Burkholderia sp. ABCPW 14 TaxID=1637860 RepID=UPI000770BF45|nr:RICIN domain-containing protein [Burkholderia sp. ABCPW 14]KVD76973.1 hypothetical protein WS62_31300 [Burkholderia sp. ABCPW 14]